MIPEADQIQAIGNAVAGYGLVTSLSSEYERVWRARDFSAPWKKLALAVLEAEPGEERAWLEAAAAELTGGQALLERVLAVAPPVRFPSLEEVAERLRPIEWLWPEWIPLGMISLLGAVPGAGKSFLALDLARRIIANEGFPDGAVVPAPSARVIYVDAEAVPQLINQRVEAWGMDKSRLFLMLPTTERMFIDFSEEEDREHLMTMATRLAPGLVVIDSLSSISSKGENDVQDVRGIMAFLNLVARENRCGLLLIHHLKKANNRERDGMVGIEDLRGSGHIVAIARSVLGLSVVQTGPKFDRNGPRRLEIIKTNLTGYPAPIGVEFVAMGDGVELRYGEPPVLYKRQTLGEECEDWLLQYLEEMGEVRPKVIVVAGREKGFSRAMIYRAREDLGAAIGDSLGCQNPKNCWRLTEMDGDEEGDEG